MGLYKLQWKNSAKKELKKLDRAIIPKILKTVEQLTFSSSSITQINSK